MESTMYAVLQEFVNPKLVALRQTAQTLFMLFVKVDTVLDAHQTLTARTVGIVINVQVASALLWAVGASQAAQTINMALAPTESASHVLKTQIVPHMESTMSAILKTENVKLKPAPLTITVLTTTMLPVILPLRLVQPANRTQIAAYMEPIISVHLEPV